MTDGQVPEARLKLLHQLLADCRRSAFYADKLREVGWDRELPVSFQEFCERTPFTTKAELVLDRERYPPFGSNLTVPLVDYTRFCHTSGTSGGQPMAWVDTSASWRAMLEGWRQVYRAAGVEPGVDRIMFAFSFGPFLGFWTAFDAATPECLSLPGGGLSSVGRLALMKRFGATVLCSTPTYALRLGGLAAVGEGARQRDLRVRTLILAGEPGASLPATRERLQQLWPGARLVDHHGMTEVGPVSYEHPLRQGSLVIMEDQFIAELIDPESGRPLPMDGTQEGELVLTTLQRAACPLLRYRTGDLVRARRVEGETPPVMPLDPALAGSSTLELDGGVLGRCDDMRLVRGVNIYPSAVEDVVRRFGQIQEFEVHERTVDDMREIEILIEVASGQDSPIKLARKLERELRDQFSLRVPVRVVAPGSLPRHEFKSRRWRV